MSLLEDNSSAFHPVVPRTSTVTTTEVNAMIQTLAAIQPLMSQTTTVTSADSQDEQALLSIMLLFSHIPTKTLLISDLSGNHVFYSPHSLLHSINQHFCRSYSDLFNPDYRISRHPSSTVICEPAHYPLKVLPSPSSFQMAFPSENLLLTTPPFFSTDILNSLKSLQSFIASNSVTSSSSESLMSLTSPPLSLNLTSTLPFMPQDLPGPSGITQFSPSLSSLLSGSLSLGNNIVPESRISLSPGGSTEAFQLRRFSAPETTINMYPQIQENRRYSDIALGSLLMGNVGAGLEVKTRQPRKQRTIYGARQTEVLEEAFHTHRYMVGTEREALAARLGLSEAQVRVWFQNRRSKQRKINKYETHPGQHEEEEMQEEE